MLAALGMAAVTHPLSLIARFKDGSHLAADDIIGTVRGNPSLASEVDAETGNRPLHYACCNRAPLPVVQALLTANPKAARLDAFSRRADGRDHREEPAKVIPAPTLAPALPIA